MRERDVFCWQNQTHSVKDDLILLKECGTIGAAGKQAILLMVPLSGGLIKASWREQTALRGCEAGRSPA